MIKTTYKDTVEKSGEFRVISVPAICGPHTQALSDCAAVMVNTSTHFTGGEQMGFGAEIGISN